MCVLRVLLATLATSLIAVGTVGAQPASRPKLGAAPDAPPLKTPRTILKVELLTGPDGGALHAQEWHAVFEKLDVELLIRRGVLDDKPEIREKPLGTLREVTAVGRLDRSGKIVFPAKSFTRTDAVALTEWINDLKTFGAQGKPDGQPVWGLSKPQLGTLLAAIGQPVEDELLDLPLADALRKLNLPAEHRLRWTTAADRQRQDLPQGVRVRQSIKGFAKATALAIILNDVGFAFRPERTPAGNIDLVVEVYDPQREFWPLGWPLEAKPPEAMPGLFVIGNLEFGPGPISEALSAAGEGAKVPVLVNYGELARRGLDLDRINVSQPLKKTTWSIALRSMLVPKRITREYWQDEAGRPFVWITPITLQRAAQE